jgi:hypothetical protein
MMEDGMSRVLFAVALGFLAMTAASAQNGPVATACKDDLVKYCPGKDHGQRDARTCLEDNKGKVSAACKSALENTGGGRGPGMGRNAK